MARARRGLGQARDRQGGGIGGHDAAVDQVGLRFAGDGRFQLTLLEDRLNDELAFSQCAGVPGRRDFPEDFITALRSHPTFFNALVEQLAAVGLALFRLFDRDVLEYRGDAARGARVGDASAHEPGAQDTDLAKRCACDIAWPAFAGPDLAHLEEERADHVLRNRVDDQAGQVACFDAQCRVHVNHQSFDGRAQDRLRRGVAASRLFLKDRRCGAHEADIVRRIGLAARYGIAFPVPWLHGRRVGFDPVARHAQHRVPVGSQSVKQSRAQAFCGAEQPPLKQVGQC